MYLQDIPGTVEIAIFGCFKFSNGYFVVLHLFTDGKIIVSEDPDQTE